MKTSEQINELVAALAAFHEKVGDIKFNRNVDYGHGKTKFKYADLSAILDVIRKPLSSVGLSVIHSFSDGNLHTTLIHSSGQMVTSVMGLGISPNADHKAVGSAITYLRRYMLVSLLSLAADEDEGEEPEASVPINPKPVQKTEKIESVQYLTIKQIQEIETLLGDDIEMLNRILTTRKASSLKEIPSKDYTFIIEALRNK